MIFYGIPKVMPEIPIYELKAICRILLLIRGQSNINPELPQPIIASIESFDDQKACVKRQHNVR